MEGQELGREQITLPELQQKSMKHIGTILRTRSIVFTPHPRLSRSFQSLDIFSMLSIAPHFQHAAFRPSAGSCLSRERVDL